MQRLLDLLSPLVSQASGALALQLVRLDETAAVWAATEEVHVLNVDTRKRTWSPPVKLDATSRLGPAGAGRSWRLVAPFLHYSD